MQVDFKNPSSHFWITALWCALGAFILGALAVISCWIRKCRRQRANNTSHSNQSTKGRKVYRTKNKYRTTSCITQRDIRSCNNIRTNRSNCYSNSSCQNYCYSNIANSSVRITPRTPLHRDSYFVETQSLYRQHYHHSYPNPPYK